MKRKKQMSYYQYLSKSLEWQFEKINKKLKEYDRKRDQENNKKWVFKLIGENTVHEH